MATLSTITATSAVIGEGMTISIKKASANYRHTIEYAFGDTNGTIAEKTGYTSITWTVPEDLMYQIPNNKTGTMILYCRTYQGDFEVGYNYIQVPISVPEDAKATVTLDCEEADSKVAALSSSFWKYTSDIKYTINATAAKGAEIVSYSITNGGETLTTATGTFKNVYDPYFYVVVTDSRGMVTNQRFYEVLYDYIRLTCNLELKEVDPEDGIITMSINGNFFYSTFHGTQSKLNTLTLTVKSVDKDDNVVTKTVTPTIDTANNTYTAEVSFEGIDYREVYDITAYASDKLMDVQSKTVSVAGKPIFDWSNEDFRFHIPVTEVGGYPWADFIIEYGEEAMGSNGTWYWRKWKSGRAECYGTRNFGKAVNNTYLISGSSYGFYRTGHYNQPLPEGLFIDTPDFIDIRMSTTSTAETAAAKGALIYIPGRTDYEGWSSDNLPLLPSKDNTGSFCFIHTANSASGSNLSAYQYPATFVCFNVIGRWK